MVILQKHFLGKRVWLSGHTGFKGGWLATCLLEAGARITGFSLAPQTPFFSQLKLKNRLKHELGDLRDGGKVRKSILRCRPDFVFHLAAQPLVRDSYLHPLETYEINTLGTAHVLEALREVRHSCAAVFITTDKVYKNEEKRHAFHEEDPLGGKDPYSASKAAAEILIASYRDSFFRNHPVRIASARSGNVIGGGDYSLDRIMPDAFRALRRGRPIPVRNPRSIRPWQHVLEPTCGYLALAANLARSRKHEGAYNFGGPCGKNTPLTKHGGFSCKTVRHAGISVGNPSSLFRRPYDSRWSGTKPLRNLNSMPTQLVGSKLRNIKIWGDHEPRAKGEKNP